MKKIGILTFHRSVNNGAVMQAYALSTRLQKEYPNYEVEIIDYHMKKISDSYHFTFWKYVKRENPFVSLGVIRELAKDPHKLKRLNQRTAIFEKSFSKLPLSDFTIESDNPEELFERINGFYDSVIVGSDAVWNYVARGFPNAFFLSPHIMSKKLSYAASCYGMDFSLIEDNVRNEIGKLLTSFDYIGVRDEATEKFVRWSGCSIQPHHTCDPTAFIDLDSLPIDIDLLKEKLKRKGFDFSRPTIGVMGSEKMGHMVRRLFGDSYQIVGLYEYLHSANVNLYDIDPFEWAYVFRFFKLTFTTFFHGTMLSLRNGVPLICVSLNTEFEKKFLPKTKDVLRRLGFEEWYFTTDYESENIIEIKEMAQKLLTSDLHDEIIEKINIEAESFNSFKSALDTLLSEGETK